MFPCFFNLSVFFTFKYRNSEKTYMLVLLHTLLKFITVILSHAHDTKHEEKDNEIIFFKYTTDGLVKMNISEEDISFESSSEDEITESDMIGIKVLTFTEN
ncbi:hypothetical protein CDIK_4380, partial [Cucumispora dikerogammari]